MSETTVTRYVMNPAEDVVIYGDELAEGMWVLPESSLLRHGRTEDERLRAERFCKVTKLRKTVERNSSSLFGGSGHIPAQISFIAEWVDGYQAVRDCAQSWGWIVKKDSIPGAETSEAADADGGETP